MIPLITEHEFLEDVPLDSMSRALILGTIHPWRAGGIKDFACAFFYGNKYSLWGILKEIFPYLPIDKKEEIRCPYEAAEKIKAMLRHYHIAISDTLIKAIRPDDEPSADRFLPGSVYHHELIPQIRDAHDLKTIFFTGKKAFDIFRSLYLQTLAQEGLCAKGVFPAKVGSADIFTMQDNLYAGRALRCVLLPSPSPGAARGKSRAFLASGFANYNQWRLQFYQEVFSEIF